MKSSMTQFVSNGQVLIRAHAWTKEGYSSKTFATAPEADFWIRSKKPKLVTV